VKRPRCEPRDTEGSELRLRLVEDLGGGEIPERKHLEAVVRIEDGVDVLPKEVDDRVGVGREACLRAVRRAAPPFEAAVEALGARLERD
jgi:hypothetical protein